MFPDTEKSCSGLTSSGVIDSRSRCGVRTGPMIGELQHFSHFSICFYICDLPLFQAT